MVNTREGRGRKSGHFKIRDERDTHLPRITLTTARFIGDPAVTRGFSFGKKGKGNRNARETLPSFENEETGIPGNGNWHCCSRRTTFAVNPPSGVRRPLIYCSLVVNLHRRLYTCLPSRIVPMKGGRKIVFVRNAVEQSPKNVEQRSRFDS